MALVVGLGWKFGLLTAIVVMSVLTIPYITKATETSLAQVPVSYREGAEALGIPAPWALRRIVLKTALPGMVTGFLLAPRSAWARPRRCCILGRLIAARARRNTEQ